MRTIYRLHLEDQLQGFWRDFEAEWLPFEPRLARAGMDEAQMDELKFRCWIRFLQRHRILVDDYLDRT